LKRHFCEPVADAGQDLISRFASLIRVSGQIWVDIDVDIGIGCLESAFVQVSRRVPAGCADRFCVLTRRSRSARSHGQGEHVPSPDNATIAAVMTNCAARKAIVVRTVFRVAMVGSISTNNRKKPAAHPRPVGLSPHEILLSKTPGLFSANARQWVVTVSMWSDLGREVENSQKIAAKLNHQRMQPSEGSSTDKVGLGDRFHAMFCRPRWRRGMDKGRVSAALAFDPGSGSRWSRLLSSSRSASDPSRPMRLYLIRKWSC